MNVWLYIRAALLVFVAVATLFVPLGPQARPPIGWEALAIIFIFCPVALVFVLGLQVVNPLSAKEWRHPSWNANPFNFSEPLQFFHLGAYVCLVQGVVTIARVAVSPVQFYVESLVPLAMAAGIFVGLQLVMRVFSSKVVHGT